MSKFVLKKLPEGVQGLKAKSPELANRLISRYDGMVYFIDRPEVLTEILFMQEAVKSSQIEGTIATIADILDYKVNSKNKEMPVEKIIDIEEIENYKKALKYAFDELDESNDNVTILLIKNLQSMLLNNSRGKNKLRGAFKRSQNYIGNKYDNKITYTPVSAELTQDYMEDLIKFININDLGLLDPIVKVAVIHAQFELIHPFEDGNGRVGRILVPILLKKYGIIEKPFFYISYHLSTNRNKYIECLEKISIEENWANWVDFFVKAVEEQAKMLIEILKELKDIEKETKKRIQELKTQYSILVIDYLFKRIKFDSSHFIKKTQLHPATARDLLKKMTEKGIISIERVSAGTKPAVYKFDALYEVIKRMED
ncbi:MAG: Fic family protein [Proteobacteria bacterium]|nr:Fic family protein [Pseudomonadota bacterium]